MPPRLGITLAFRKSNRSFPPLVHVARTAIHDFAFDDTLNIIPNSPGYDCFDRFIVNDAIFPAARRQGHAHELFIQDIGENERCHDATSDSR